MVVIINCNDKTAGSETKKIQSNIQEVAILQYKNTPSFIMKMKNLIYEHEGRRLKIPIFQGNMGDVSYDEFRQYSLNKKYLKPNEAESCFIIKTDKGKLTKTFREFLVFYKGNILKNIDINKPSKIHIFDEGNITIYYDFEVSGVSFVLQLDIVTNDKIKNLDSIKSVFDINLDETLEDPIFRYRFWDDYKSDEL
jgi:hypothetical protein